jgi:xanthine dehydrogenase YagR molybdenum-binding subunit
VRFRCSARTPWECLLVGTVWHVALVHINADFAGYHMSAHADVPDVEADFVPDYEPDIASGIKGVGEIGTCGTAAAIANAVWHATGRRYRSLPIRLDQVVEDRVPR